MIQKYFAFVSIIVLLSSCNFVNEPAPVPFPDAGTPDVPVALTGGRRCFARSFVLPPLSAAFRGAKALQWINLNGLTVGVLYRASRVSPIEQMDASLPMDTGGGSSDVGSPGRPLLESLVLQTIDPAGEIHEVEIVSGIESLADEVFVARLSTFDARAGYGNHRTLLFWSAGSGGRENVYMIEELAASNGRLRFTQPRILETGHLDAVTSSWSSAVLQVARQNAARPGYLRIMISVNPMRGTLEIPPAEYLYPQPSENSVGVGASRFVYASVTSGGLEILRNGNVAAMPRHLIEFGPGTFHAYPSAVAVTGSSVSWLVLPFLLNGELRMQTLMEDGGLLSQSILGSGLGIDREPPEVRIMDQLDYGLPVRTYAVWSPDRQGFVTGSILRDGALAGTPKTQTFSEIRMSSDQRITRFVDTGSDYPYDRCNRSIFVVETAEGRIELIPVNASQL